MKHRLRERSRLQGAPSFARRLRAELDLPDILRENRWGIMTDSESPSGRFRIAISAWEARMSLWIETPTVLDKATGETLLSFKDSNWSLDAARWLSDSVVELTLRKYPGNHLPTNVVATLDCANRNAKIGETEVKSLTEVEPALEKALTWRTVDPPRPAPRGCAGMLRRFFFGK